MVKIIYEDSELLVVEKPAGLESQSSKKLEPDMVSEIKSYLIRKEKKKEREERGRLSPNVSTFSSTEIGEPYVGVIHRLDKPVTGVMVYAKTQDAAAFLSREVQEQKMIKIYHAVICGKPVDNVGNFVDRMVMDKKRNYSFLVDKSEKEGKKAELSYCVIGENREDNTTLVEIQLKTGRHHQIRVQFAGHGLPLWGDSKYNPQFGGTIPSRKALTEDLLQEDSLAQQEKGMSKAREPLALSAVSLSFIHPSTGKRMTFSIEPRTGAFRRFQKKV